VSAVAEYPIIRVTARDLELGDEGVKELRPGQFVVICAEPLYVAHEQRHRNGTVVITLKRREGGGGSRG
jgi:hypothetical protein